MSWLSGTMAATTVLSFIILWAVIHFGSRWIPPNAGDDMPVWKSFLLAAAATVINMLLVGLVVGIIAPSG